MLFFSLLQTLFVNNISEEGTLRFVLNRQISYERDKAEFESDTVLLNDSLLACCLRVIYSISIKISSVGTTRKRSTFANFVSNSSYRY